MLLEVKNLSTSFQTPTGRFKAVKNLSCELEKGRTLGIVGESGSGKSVTALSIMRLIQEPGGQIESGEIKIDGVDLLKLPRSEMRKIRGSKVSMIFQEPMTSLNPVFSVGDQIDEAVLLHNSISKSKARSRSLEMMELVGISDPKLRVNFFPHQLSGGLRQRVMIAMALACEPDLLIADEPTTALDVTIQGQILRLMKKLQKELGMSLVMITHDFGVIAEMADDVIVMYAGEVVERQDVFGIFNKPKHPYTQALQKAIPDFKKRENRLYSIPFMVPSLQELAGGGIDLEQRWKKLETDLKQSIGKEELNTPPKNKPDGSELLKIENLKVHYPVYGGFFGRKIGLIPAVDGVSFSIKTGETLGLVGESGCGKSTLGKTILRLVEPQEGEINFNNRNVVGLSGEDLRLLRKEVQIIFQDPYSSLNPRMKVGSILAEPLIIHKLAPRNQLKQRVHELLDMVGLGREAFDKYPHEFSGGQRQRIGIARALAVDPKFIVADEPVSALDVSIQAQILNLLKDLQSELGLTYLFISHDLNVVQYLCDRVLVMYEGQIVEELTPNQIQDLNIKKHDYTESLLQAIPIRHPDERKAI